MTNQENMTQKLSKVEANFITGALKANC